MILVRIEQPTDICAVRLVNDKTFGQRAEGIIVDKLRKSCQEILSVVAISDIKVVGHILFSPATIEKQGEVIEGMGLAPIAVLPEFQNQRIGTQLVNKGILFELS